MNFSQFRHIYKKYKKNFKTVIDCCGTLESLAFSVEQSSPVQDKWPEGEGYLAPILAFTGQDFMNCFFDEHVVIRISPDCVLYYGVTYKADESIYPVQDKVHNQRTFPWVVGAKFVNLTNKLMFWTMVLGSF